LRFINQIIFNLCRIVTTFWGMQIRRNHLLDIFLFGRHVTTLDIVEDELIKHLVDLSPYCVSRFGGIELDAIYRKRFQLKKRMKDKTLHLNAGFFPLTDVAIEKFGEMYLEAARHADALVCWGFITSEVFVYRELPRNIKLVDSNLMKFFDVDRHWIKYLEGRRVLVIHPFEDSIEKQWSKKDKLHKPPFVLPNFDLITFKAVQTIAGETSGYDSWFDALEDMKNKISKIDFDIALIGCGAYGLPLAAHVKDMGKIAIHIGGSLQLLFGIKGNRWNDRTDIITDNWIAPLPQDCPQGKEVVEKACYW
jgi:hypothetical protein